MRIYVIGGPEGDAPVLAELARMGHRAATAASGGREAAAASEMVLAFDDGTGDAVGLGVELGLALGAGKTAWLVGQAGLGPGAADFATAGLFRAFGTWEEARAALEALPGPAARPEPPEPPEPEPELDIDLGALPDEYVLAMWKQHGVSILTLCPHLERYAPGLSARVGAYRRSRNAIYAAALAAWRAAGGPGGFASGQDPVAGPWADHAACMAWLGGCVRLAQLDSELDELAARKKAALAALAGGGQVLPLPAAAPHAQAAPAAPPAPGG